MRRFLQILLTIVLAACVLFLIGGQMGALHPAGDALAVLRPYLGGLALLLALFLAMAGAARRALLALAAALYGFAPFLPWPEAHATSAPGFTIYQKNMLFRNPAPVALGADILARAPDFVTLQEVSTQNRPVLDQLANAYPARQFCAFSGVGGVAVASRFPMVPDSALCAPRGGMVAMQVETPAGPVWVVSIHQHWPWPYRQARQAARLRPLLAALAGPKVIGGDFNMVPWAWRMHDIERATDTGILGRTLVTLVHNDGLLRVPIDHVLVTGGQGTVERLPRLGSDHYGVLARFALAGN